MTCDRESLYATIPVANHYAFRHSSHRLRCTCDILQDFLAMVSAGALTVSVSFPEVEIYLLEESRHTRGHWSMTWMSASTRRRRDGDSFVPCSVRLVLCELLTTSNITVSAALRACRDFPSISS